VGEKKTIEKKSGLQCSGDAIVNRGNNLDGKPPNHPPTGGRFYRGDLNQRNLIEDVAIATGGGSDSWEGTREKTLERRQKR